MKLPVLSPSTLILTYFFSPIHLFLRKGRVIPSKKRKVTQFWLGSLQTVVNCPSLTLLVSVANGGIQVLREFSALILDCPWPSSFSLHLSHSLPLSWSLPPTEGQAAQIPFVICAAYHSRYAVACSFGALCQHCSLHLHIFTHTDGYTVHTSLAMSKSRLPPKDLKPKARESNERVLTIVRLELLAALVATHLGSYVTEALTKWNPKTY